jgi:hypothetical protein
MRWERIGATPHLLKYPLCLDLNGNVGQEGTGCETYKHRQILFTVDLVLHSTAFAEEPVAGEEKFTLPIMQFCPGDGSLCSSAALKILHKTTTDIDNQPHTIIYCVYQRMVSYTNSQGANATAIFRSTTSNGNSIKRFDQCQGSDVIPDGTICLAPRQGSFLGACSECLLNFASLKVDLSAVVTFADGCSSCVPPYDVSRWNSHKVYPVTNHHSPLVTTIPVITVPRLSDQSSKVFFPLHAVDEDGMGRPIECRGTASCNNINAQWTMTGASSDKLSLEQHSDAVPPGNPLGVWVLDKRDDNDGGGLLVSVSGPLKEPNGATALKADAMYPAKLAVSDAFGVLVTQEFMMRVCPSIDPYRTDAQGVSLAFNEHGLVAPIIVSRGASEAQHERASGRHRCFAGEPCVFTVTAVAYDSSSPGGAMYKARGCEWGLSRRALEGNNSTRCIDNVRTLDAGEAVEIDVSHAALQGCARSLTSNVFDPTCHGFSTHNPEPGVSVTTVTLFGGRTLGKAYPAVSDIGRKLGLCFQVQNTLVFHRRTVPDPCHNPSPETLTTFRALHLQPCTLHPKP